jgi:uncharacterized protein YndB with AHSA1/START domain
MDVADTNASTGFALSRVLPGTPAEVFDHFTNPALFSRWFIVEGFTTPATRTVRRSHSLPRTASWSRNDGFSSRSLTRPRP